MPTTRQPSQWFLQVIIAVLAMMPVAGHGQSAAGSPQGTSQPAPAAKPADVDHARPATTGDSHYILGDDGQKVFFLSQPTPAPADTSRAKPARVSPVSGESENTPKQP